MKEFKSEFKYLDSSGLFVESLYQRPLDTGRVKKIVSNFNPNLVNPVKVSFRDGKYWIFDGQHTARALVLKNDGNNLPVYCKVHYGMTIEDEARLFAEQFGLSRAVSSSQKLLSNYIANDVNVVSFKECVESLGIRCTFKKTNGGKALICYSNAYSIFMKYGEDHLKSILRIIIEAWNANEASLRREIVSGLDVFLRTYRETEKFSRDSFVSKLEKVSPIEIIRNGKLTSVGGAKRFGREMLRIYNHNRTQKNRLEDLF